MALFAALSWAITQSGRGGGTITEQDTIYAAQIVQAGADLKAGVLLMTINGTPSTSIVTQTPATHYYAGWGTLNDGNAANFCTTGVTCLFASDGGNVTLPQVPRNAYLPSYGAAFPSYFAGAKSFNGFYIDGLMPGWGTSDLAISGIGTAANDDIVEFYPLTKDVCAAINKGLGISGIPNWGSGPSVESACVDRLGNGTAYMYYQVLVAN